MKKLLSLSLLIVTGYTALAQQVVTNVVYVTNTVVVPQQQIVYPGQPTPQTVVVQPAPTVIYQPAPVVVEPIIVRLRFFLFLHSYFTISILASLRNSKPDKSL